MKTTDLRNIRKTFGQRQAVCIGDLSIKAGRMVALIGPSGAGKSTLLRLMAGLIAADRGSESRIRIHGQTIQENGRLAGNARDLRARIGFIFQQFGLTGRLSLLQNVLAGTLARVPVYRKAVRWFTHREKAEAMRALDFVGMSPFAAQRASTLSGGQQQRGAVARAIVQRAKLVLADEPIASLDPESARLVMQKLRDMNQRDGVTVVVSVHQIEYANYCDDVVTMKDGRVLEVCRADELDLDKLKAIYGDRFEAMHATSLSPPPIEGAYASLEDQLSRIDMEARAEA